MEITKAKALLSDLKSQKHTVMQALVTQKYFKKVRTYPAKDKTDKVTEDISYLRVNKFEPTDNELWCEVMEGYSYTWRKLGMTADAIMTAWEPATEDEVRERYMLGFTRNQH